MGTGNCRALIITTPFCIVEAVKPRHKTGDSPKRGIRSLVTTSPVPYWFPHPVSKENKPVFRTVYTLWKSNDEKFGTLVFEESTEKLVAILPKFSFNGNCFILDRCGQLMLPCNELAESKLLKLAQQGQKEGLGNPPEKS
ncbi:MULTISPECIES: hypothetical protein, partial [unclassified Serratia (in: enterobacteria)]|uniref:hypothetical protein n=1 Tax=unclassified Serratia (in: enterobacteria) TaxID=2647522 RepID=UPI001E4F9C61